MSVLEGFWDRVGIPADVEGAVFVVQLVYGGDWCDRRHLVDASEPEEVPAPSWILDGVQRFLEVYKDLCLIREDDPAFAISLLWVLEPVPSEELQIRSQRGQANAHESMAATQEDLEMDQKLIQLWKLQ